jgi:hypothetical protein
MTTPEEMTTAELAAHALAIATAKTKETFVLAFSAYVRDVVERETDPYEKIALFVHSMIGGAHEMIGALIRYRGGGSA